MAISPGGGGQWNEKLDSWVLRVDGMAGSWGGGGKLRLGLDARLLSLAPGCSPLLATMTFLMGLYSRRRTFGEVAGAAELRRMPRSFRPPQTVRNFSI